MTIVKVQRPITSNVGDLWLIYDQLHARECSTYGKDIPIHVREEMQDSYTEFYEAEWDQETLTWELKQKTHRRKW